MNSSNLIDYKVYKVIFPQTLKYGHRDRARAYAKLVDGRTVLSEFPPDESPYIIKIPYPFIAKQQNKTEWFIYKGQFCCYWKDMGIFNPSNTFELIG